MAEEEILSRNKLESTKPWIVEEILKLITDWNKLRKESDFEGYKTIKNQVTNQCKQETEKWVKVAEEIKEGIKRGRQGKAYGTSKLRSINTNQDKIYNSQGQTRNIVDG